MRTIPSGPKSRSKTTSPIESPARSPAVSERAKAKKIGANKLRESADENHMKAKKPLETAKDPNLATKDAVFERLLQ